MSAVTFWFFIVLFTATTSKECGLGKFLRNGKCVFCPPGTYQDESNSTSCQPCPIGRFSSFKGAHGVDICRSCPRGTFRNQTGGVSVSDCNKCPPGTSSERGSPSCISCPPGTRISKCDSDIEFFIFDECFYCADDPSTGECFDAGPVRAACNRCLFGFITNSSNAFSCQRCPVDTIINDDQSKCIPQPKKTCPAGFESVRLGTKCRPCQFGQFNDGSTTFCRDCPPGQVPEFDKKSKTCKPCPSGTFAKPSATRCTACPSGQNTFVRGAQFCISDNATCPPNTFVNRWGACLKCSIYQVFNKQENRCESCPEDSLSEGGVSTFCTPCGDGMETSERHSHCVCKPGWGFVPGSGGTKCEKCPPGTANSDPVDICQKCLPHYFAPAAGTLECLQCPKGFRQPLPGQAKCNEDPACPKGLLGLRGLGDRAREPSDRLSKCVVPRTNCPPNNVRSSLQGALERPVCEPLSPDACPLDTIYRRKFKGFTCGTCSENQRYDPSISGCKDCREGATSAGGTTQICSKCSFVTPGFRGACRCDDAQMIVGSACVPCPPGTMGYIQIDGCVPCPVGTFSSRSGSRTCENCPAGFFTGKVGQSACKPCPMGLVSSGIGDSGCVPTVQRSA